MNLSNHADLSPEDCTRRWEMGARHEGVGASATLVYVAPPIWRRSLTVARRLMPVWRQVTSRTSHIQNQ